MKCDRYLCTFVSAGHESMPSLASFVAEGWFIAATYGDRCPACVTRAGGLAAVLARPRTIGDPATPHHLMTVTVEGATG